MTEKVKNNKKIEIILITLYVINLIAVIGSLICIVIENNIKKEPKQASAQVTEYYIEAGIYKFKTEVNFNPQLAQQQGGEITIPDPYSNTGKMKLSPQPVVNQFISAPMNDIYSLWIDATTEVITVEYPKNGNQNPNDLEIIEIYNNSYKWHQTYMLENNVQTKQSIETYTLILLEKQDVNEYTYWFFQNNTEVIAGGAVNNQEYNNGYQTGYQQGIQDTINNNSGGFDGYQNGYNAGQAQGYQQGYQQAMKEIDTNNPYTFNNLIGAVMRAPSEFFKSFWGTEILGFNLSGLISVMFTMALVIAIFGVIKKFV